MVGGNPLGKQRSKSLVLSAALVAATGVVFAGGARLRNARAQSATPLQPVGRSMVATGEKATPLTSESGRSAQGFGGTFETIYALVQDQYCDKLPTESKLARGVVRQMIAVLEDPNSYYLEPEQRKLLEDEGKGKLSGLGAALTIVGTKKDGYTDYKIVVVAPLPGSAAEKAGLKPGDVITHVDGKWILGYNPLLQYSKILERFKNRDADEDEVEKARLATRDRITGGILLHQAQMLLRGDTILAKTIAAKPKYAIKLQRPGVTTPISAEITPSVTTPPTVAFKTVTGEAGYLKVPFFSEETPTAVEKALDSLPKAGPGLVLDLRGNPGGSFDAVQKIAGLLAGKGTIAIEVGAKGKKTPLLSSDAPKYKGRITVLVDRGTASTAEALASYLQDRGVGSLVGQRTFGDGQVQALFPLEDGSGFTLSIGKLTTSKGIAWNGIGLAPQLALAPGTPEDQVIARAVAALTTAPKVAQTPATKG